MQNDTDLKLSFVVNKSCAASLSTTHPSTNIDSDGTALGVQSTACVTMTSSSHSQWNGTLWHAEQMYTVSIILNYILCSEVWMFAECHISLLAALFDDICIKRLVFVNTVSISGKTK